LLGQGTASCPNSGPTNDPLVGGVDKFKQVLIGDNLGRDKMTYPKDAH
jgi:hypothetical protein